ncbi:MAG: hypothetical protein F4X31_11370 [Gammaproteobacteria bacterium]|nr:hypothetical protein [Gammaproteobacteria bacterium]
MSFDLIERALSRGLVNKAKLMGADVSTETGVVNQLYVEGLWLLEKDEALVLEIEVPKNCHKDCDNGPEPTITHVSLTEVREHLPANTPTVTASQREEQPRLRRQGTQLRRFW